MLVELRRINKFLSTKEYASKTKTLMVDACLMDQHLYPLLKLYEACEVNYSGCIHQQSGRDGE